MAVIDSSGPRRGGRREIAHMRGRTVAPLRAIFEIFDKFDRRLIVKSLKLIIFDDLMVLG